MSAEPPPDAGRGAPGPPRLRALVVEDNPGDRILFSEMLRARGYEFLECPDGESAWEAFQADPSPLVLLDLILPGIDGVELCRRIRAHPRGGETVVLALTGAAESSALTRLLEAGVDDFLAKPVDPRLLRVRLEIAERRIGEVAERRRTQEALASMTEELQLLFENLDDVFFSVDIARRRLVRVSPSARELFGVGPEELARDGALWERCLLPSTPEEEGWERLAATPAGAAFAGEHLVTLPDGTRRWVRTRIRVEAGPDGRPGRADGVAIDVTPERRARTELAARNEELAALYTISAITMTADGIEEAYAQILEQVAAVMDVPIVALEHIDGELDRVTLVAARGIEGAHTSPWSQPFHGLLQGRAVERRQAVVETDPRTIRAEVPALLAGLDLRFFAAFPLLAGSRVLGTLLLASDRSRGFGPRAVSLASNLATSVALYFERLEAEEAQRTSEARFRRMAGELQQANQELESFAYSVSHDLRAPLRTIQGFAHALLQRYGGELSEGAADFARRIIASGQQLEALIADLLAYSRVSFEDLDLRPTDLGSVVQEAVEQLRADLDAADVDLEVEAGLPAALGHRTVLVQVVSNLLTNAIKFVPAGTRPRVRVRHTRRDGRIRLWIEDNGIGIPEGQEERIFGVFERLGDAAEVPGTGIGLAIVRRGMQRLGGRCGVDALEEGSAFWIELLGEERRRWKPWERRKG